ncbi:hypothetical protein H311_01838 [Anncaliia algerae PRA109]|nr:hypothetical protein H311_01838 [Anncaliia algerae PRA109]
MHHGEIFYFTFGMIFSLGSYFKFRLLHVISLLSFFTMALHFVNRKNQLTTKILFKIITPIELYISLSILMIEHVFMRKKCNSFYFMIEKIAVFICVAGLFISIYSIFYLNKYKSKEKEFISSGPYSFVRHPIYLGFFVFIIGCELYLSCYVSAFITLFFMFTKIRERIMDEENCLSVDENYKTYKKKVSSGFFI